MNCMILGHLCLRLKEHPNLPVVIIHELLEVVEAFFVH